MAKWDRMLLAGFFLLFVISLAALARGSFLENTATEPANGGLLREGIVGQLRGINPVYGNSDTERDTIELLFSGL